MRIRDPIAEGEEPYNLVPLTDMVFNLLIFFMCATTFVQVEKEMSLALPKIQSARGLTNPLLPEPLIINIRQNGSTVISGKTYPDSASLAMEVRRRKAQTVVIRADQNAIVKYFAEVAGVCKQEGVKEAKLVYIDTGGK